MTSLKGLMFGKLNEFCPCGELPLNLFDMPSTLFSLVLMNELFSSILEVLLVTDY